MLRFSSASVNSQLMHSSDLDASHDSMKTKPLGFETSTEDYHKVLHDQSPCKGSTSRGQKHSPQTSLAHGVEAPRRSMPAPTRRHGFPFSLLSPRMRTSADLLDSRGHIARSENSTASSDNKFNGLTSDSRSPTTQDTEITTSETRGKTPLSVRLGYKQENRYSLPSDLGSTDVEATPTKRRAVHRQARLIDGALFHGRTRKGKVVGSEKGATKSPVKVVTDVAAKRSSGQSTQQSSRASWLHNVLTRFRGEHDRNSKQPKLRKQHSTLAGCISSGPHITRSSMPTQHQNTAHYPEMRQTTSLRGLGFNGACDEHNNKPLPLSPAEQGGRPSIQSETQRSFFGRNNEKLSSAVFNPTASFASSGVTGIKEKDELRSLVSATMSGPQELSPKVKAWKHRFSSSSSRSDPPSSVHQVQACCIDTDLCRPTSISSFVTRRSNPPSIEPPRPGIVTIEPFVHHKDSISSTFWPFRGPQDRPEPVENDSVVDCDVLQQMRDPVTYISRRVPLGPEEEHYGRGRRPTPPTSPSRLRCDLKNSPPKTPRPRSRSPVKKLMGMVKSMSTNQIPSEPALPKAETPASTNKRRWKDLSNKLRHGFLTADLEQMEQENMMEQYATNQGDGIEDDIRIITPPPSRQRTVFPVSIRSSGQSKLWSELEYMLIETCNCFLKEELEHGRLSRDSILRAKRQWQARNRPQVIEFYYDQATQYDITIANLKTVRLYSDYAQDAVMLTSVLHQWKILIRELAVKTLCMPDSIVRRWLHDGRRVLELLGASQITLSHLDRLSSLCLAVIGSAEKERAKTRHRAGTTNTQGSHRRSASDGSTHTLSLHEQALLRGQETPPPPLPTPTSTSSASRKVTPQERRIAQARTQKGPGSHEAKHFVFTHGHGHPIGPGHGHSRSLGQNGDIGRYAFE